MDFNFKKLYEKLTKNSKKTMSYALIVLLAGVLLILISDVAGNLKTPKTKEPNTAVEVNSGSQTASAVYSSSYEESLKRELTDILSQISGVGKVSVVIYFRGTQESVPATNINSTDKKVDEKDNQGGTRTTTETSKTIDIVVVNEGGGTKPFILRQVRPEIGGVLVVAEGAENSELKERLKVAVKTVLNISANKVSVEPMK